MPYSKLLKKVIAESGYTNKEIIEECNKRNRKIDKAYLSKLQNNKVPAPSEEISRTIANICNVDERLLVLEGYIDKAPKEIKEAFESIKLSFSFAILSMFEDEFKKLDDKAIKQIEDEIYKTPLSDFIISLIDNKEYIINMKKQSPQFVVDKDKITLNIAEPLALQVKDNGMYPVIQEGSKVILKFEEKYNNGDILVIKIKDKEDTYFVRYALFNNDEIILTAINKTFKTITEKKENVTILGKVVKVIMDI